MTHQVVIIKSISVPPATSAATVSAEPQFSVTVEYRPADGMTASQIGDEVARIQRHVNKIIGAAAD